MFDVISGLPVHALVVHAAVAFLPLMAVVSALVAARPGWRGALRWVLAADVAVFAVCLVAGHSGEVLQARLSQTAGHVVAHDHGELGGTIPVFALLLVVATAFAWFATRRGGVLVPVSVVAVALAGLASIGMVVAVGHSGAQATWQERIAGTTAPTGEVDADG